MTQARLGLVAGLFWGPATLFALGMVLTLPQWAMSAGVEEGKIMPTCTTEGAEMTDKVVVAQVVLRAADGSSIFDSEETMTADVAERYKIDEDRVRLAREKLSAHGFDVVAAGPFSLSIRGDKRVFEEVFSTRLQERQTEAVESGFPEDLRMFFEAQGPVEVPPDLAPFVATVTFPRPPELFP